MKNTVENNKLGISQIGLTVSSPGLDAGSKQNILDHICKLLVICVMCAGMCSCFSYAFGLYADTILANCILALVILTVYITGLFKKKVRTISRIVLAVLAVIAAVIFRNHVISGLEYAVGHIFANYNSYYGLKLAAFEYETYTDIDRNLSAIFLILPLACFQVKVMQRDVTLKLSFLSIMIYLLAMFLCGCMPDTIFMLMVLIPFACQIGERCICSYSAKIRVAMDNGTSAGLRGIAILLTGITMVLSSILGYGLFYDGTESIAGPIRDAVYNSSLTALFDRIKGGYSAGGINGGSLNNSNGVKFDSSVHLNVTYSENQTSYTYLKGYVGAVYTGKKWDELPKSVYKTESYYAISDYDEGDILSLSFNIVSKAKAAGDGLFKNLKISTVEVEIPNTYVNDAAYVCAPYIGLLSDEDGVITDLDYLIRRSGKLTNYFSCFTYTDRNYFTSSSSGLFVDIEKMNNYLNTHNDVELNELLELEGKYRTFVYENYLDVSDSCKRIYDEFSAYSGMDVSDAIELVQNTLADNCKYSLKPGATPSGEDMVEYFYYTSKVGYCTHFASAAVLMFRSMGIPARYVQGYLVPACSADKTVTVTDSSAHAWAEIYVDGFGWIPVEATPGGDGTSGSFTPDINDRMNDEPETTKDNSSQAETTKAPETTTEEKTETVTETVTTEEEASGIETEDSNTESTASAQTEYMENGTEITGNGEIDASENVTESSGEELTGGQNEESSKSGADDNSSDNHVDILGIIVKIIIAAAVIAILLAIPFINRAGKLKKRRAFKKMKNNNNAVISMFEDLRFVSGKYSFGITEEASAASLAEHYISFSSEEWSSYINISLKAMFSDDATTDDERQLVTNVYKKAIKEIYSSLNKFDRLKFKYIDGCI